MSNQVDIKNIDKKNTRCVIVAAADIKDYDFVRSFLNKDDYFIFADGGLKHANPLQIKPCLIVGDFDSYSSKELKRFDGAPIIKLSPIKDDTDSFYAAKYAYKSGFRDFILIGALGGRVDHSFANISILNFLNSANCTAKLIDDYSVLKILNKNETLIIDSKCKAFSTIAINGSVKGLNISGAKYNIKNATITPDFQYGISNEPKLNEECKVSYESGELLIVEVYNLG